MTQPRFDSQEKTPSVLPTTDSAHPKFDGKTETDYETKQSHKTFMANAAVKTMLKSVVADQLVESTESFSTIILQKAAFKLEEAKISTAQSLFGIVEEKDDEDEPEDKDFEKHPIKQLQNIADYKPNSEEEDTEYTDSGKADLRSVQARQKRIASGKVSGCPTFKHANGEESHITPDHAQHLVHTFTSTAVKPETKKAAIDMLHGSKEGLHKITKAVGTGVVKDKSIYGA